VRPFPARLFASGERGRLALLQAAIRGTSVAGRAARSGSPNEEKGTEFFMSMKIVRRDGPLALGTGLACVAAWLASCGNHSPEQRPNDPTSYDDQLSSELADERASFIGDKQEQLDELDQKIGQMKARLDHESEYVSESERADWKQDLFELEQQRAQARSRLQRAKTATPAEWKAARNDVSLTFDRLEAGVETLGSRIGRLFSSSDPSAEDRARAGTDDEASPEGAAQDGGR
jgi:hypothetical protein